MLRTRLSGARRGEFNPLFRVLSIIVLVLLVVGSYRLYKFIWPTPYVARPSGFQIVFPGIPKVDKLPTQKKSGVEVSGTIYNVDNLTKGTDYAVYATNYAGVDFSSLSEDSKVGALESQIDTIAKNDQLSIKDGKETTFKGIVALEATLYPNDPSEPSTYVLAFLNHSKVYMLLGAGITTRQFNIYTNTFNFVN
jgi:hypothetical protein